MSTASILISTTLSNEFGYEAFVFQFEKWTKLCGQFVVSQKSFTKLKHFCRSFIFTGVKVGSSTGNRIWLRVWDGGGVWAARVVPSRLLQGPRKRGEERGTRISRQQDHIPYRRHGWWCNHHTIREHLTRKALRERLINQAVFITNTSGVYKSFIKAMF